MQRGISYRELEAVEDGTGLSLTRPPGQAMPHQGPTSPDWAWPQRPGAPYGDLADPARGYRRARLAPYRPALRALARRRRWVCFRPRGRARRVRGPDGAADAKCVGNLLMPNRPRATGREWDRVLVFGASRGLFPHRLSDNEEEERRIFHVAITWARVEVVVMGDAEAPSLFLGELDGSRPRRPLTAGASAVHNAPSAAGPCRHLLAACGLPAQSRWPAATRNQQSSSRRSAPGGANCLTRQEAGLCRVQ